MTLNRWTAVARHLLENGADPNGKDVAGFTPLHLATTTDKEASLAIAALLLQFGADPNIRNRFGGVPLFESIQFGQINAVKLLVEHGADPGMESLTVSSFDPPRLDFNFLAFSSDFLIF